VSVPELTLITPELPAAELLRRVGAALAGVAAGRVALQLRAKHLDQDERRRVGEQLRELTRHRGVALLVNDEPALARALDADGVQLPERGTTIEAARAELGPQALIGASRHDLEGVTAAAREGASFVLLSPVYEVPGKGPALGVGAFASLVQACAVPVIALGGLRHDRIATVLSAGAAGIAVIREVFDAAEPGIATRELLEALSRARSSAT
jgi:thiamine-phosphate pyrophosphorylase